MKPGLRNRRRRPPNDAAASDRDVPGPLAWLRERKDARGRPLVSTVQLQAGQRLAFDFQMGETTPRVTSTWVRSGDTSHPAFRPGNLEPSERLLAARERVRRALTAIGPELAEIVFDVCCLELGLETIERRKGMPTRSGRMLLSAGLNALARHYGLIVEDRAPGGWASALRHWGAPDYRPTIEPAVPKDKGR